MYKHLPDGTSYLADPRIKLPEFIWHVIDHRVPFYIGETGICVTPLICKKASRNTYRRWLMWTLKFIMDASCQPRRI